MVQAPINSTPTRVELPRVLWITWFVSVLLLVVVGGTLLCFPIIGQFYWPWSLAPFNTRFLGAIYASAAIPLIGYLRKPQLSALRIVLPVFACFTTYLLLVSMGHTASFLPRKSSAIWFFLYGADSFVGLYFCWRFRAKLTGLSNRQYWPRLYRFQSIVLGLYGLGLLLFASMFGAAWPWPLDVFHSRLYSGLLLTAALAMELLRNCSSSLERRWFGGTQLCLGSLIFLTTWLVDMQVNKLNWTLLAPWIWQLVFLAFAAAGGWIFVNESWGLSCDR